MECKKECNDCSNCIMKDFEDLTDMERNMLFEMMDIHEASPELEPDEAVEIAVVAVSVKNAINQNPGALESIDTLFRVLQQVDNLYPEIQTVKCECEDERFTGFRRVIVLRTEIFCFVFDLLDDSLETTVLYYDTEEYVLTINTDRN